MEKGRKKGQIGKRGSEYEGKKGKKSRNKMIKG